MRFTRRECLRHGLGSSAVLACGQSIPAFLAQSAQSLGAEHQGPSERILVVVELDGGNDGLNTVVPFASDNYYRHRPRINVPANRVLKIDAQIGLHPNLRGFADLLERKQLGVIQSVGYPNMSRSHFQSAATWQSGRLEASLATAGWLSRYIDLRAPSASLDAPGIHVDSGKLALALSGGEFQPPTVSRLERLERRLGLSNEAGAEAQRADLDLVLSEERGNAGSLLRFVQKSTLVSFASSQRLRDLIRSSKNGTEAYPDYGLAERFRLIAQLIKANLNTVVYYTRLGGFDTHTNQLARHPALLAELGGSVRAFFDDLQNAGQADRVLMLVFSEFGRRVQENAAQGTDHGTAAPMFLVGPAVRGGIHGPYPDLVNLDEGDPQHAIDFRQVYSTVLEKWLNCPPIKVLPQRFDSLPIL